MMEHSERRFTASLLLLIGVQLFSGRVLFADEIEILSIVPSPPASIVGLEPWPAGGPMPALTISNSVTVVVRYRTDGAAVGAQAFPSMPAGVSGFQVVEPGVGTDPPCSSISGTSEGRCAAAFFYLCEEGLPVTVTIEQVGVSLAAADDSVIISDYEDAHITISCRRSPPRRDPGNCLVLGVAGVPGATPLPFSRETPICRCLRDSGAREFRCAFLHPDFFMVRRIPFPLPPQQQFSEVWEFLPLTELGGTVTMTLTGGGLAEPVRHVFGPEVSAQGNPLEFVTKCVGPSNPADAKGLAQLEYVMDDGQSLTFEVDRTIDETMIEPQ